METVGELVDMCVDLGGKPSRDARLDAELGREGGYWEERVDMSGDFGGDWLGLVENSEGEGGRPCRRLTRNWGRRSARGQVVVGGQGGCWR